MTETFRTMRAIPTRYRGNDMRSRTEAKSAALLDDLRIPWVYEPKIFSHNYHKGTGYLPDFQLWPKGRYRWYVEIKPMDIWTEGGSESRDLTAALDKMTVIWHSDPTATLALWLADPRSETFGYIVIKTAPTAAWQAREALQWLRIMADTYRPRPWWRRLFRR